MKELSILGGATESFVMLYDKALLQVDGAGRYDVQASLDGEHWSVLTPITAKCDHHSRTIVLDLLAGAHIRVVCVTGTLESARYSFDMGETSEAERIAAEEARVEAENKRVEAENEREVAEAARDAAEAQRVAVFNSNEEQRKKGEASREVAEAARVTSENARAKAEQGRASAEAGRADAENLRKSAESSRVTAESARVSSEGVRVNAENQRKSAETSRVNAESARANAETNRVSTEAARVNAEKERATAEGVREDNEQARVLAEAERVEAEALREERTDEAIASIANKVDRTDNAPELTSGFAGNLVGRGESTSEEIGFRPSGGLTSVNDGAARIERLKGNTLVWNQLLQCEFTNGETYGGTVKPTVQDGKGYLTFTGTGDSFTTSFRATKNHYYLWEAKLSASTGCRLFMHSYGVLTILSASTDMKVVQGIVQYTLNSVGREVMLLPLANITEPTDIVVDYYRIYDLTQMFGAGNEPTTIEEFNARKPLGIDEYAYNEGELISTTADEIKSVGFNAWDEEWENGGLSPITGIEEYNEKLIRAKNYIQILPSTIYYCSNENIEGGEATWVMFFDGQKNLIKGYKTGRKTSNNAHDILNHSFTTPATARYMRFYTSGKVYNHDICIHLAHTGYRNGEYEPYEEFRRSLPISEIKDSEGNALFPNGLLSAGSVYDEITSTKAIKRIGMVDMGTLSWLVDTLNGRTIFKTYAPGGIGSKDNKVKGNSLCSLYTNVSLDELLGTDRCVRTSFITEGYECQVAIKDPSYTDAATFKAAMQGVMLYYELAEPIEVDLEEPLNLDYEVSDFGTEEVVSDTPTTPLKADIIYQFNAVDRIRENSLSLEDLIKRVAALESQNAALVQQLNATGNGETE